VDVDDSALLRVGRWAGAGLADARVDAGFKISGDPKALWLLEGADHGETRRVSPQEYDRRVVDAVREHLGGAP
jgi:hypothetical protein